MGFDFKYFKSKRKSHSFSLSGIEENYHSLAPFNSMIQCMSSFPNGSIIPCQTQFFTLTSCRNPTVSESGTIINNNVPQCSQQFKKLGSTKLCIQIFLRPSQRMQSIKLKVQQEGRYNKSFLCLLPKKFIAKGIPYFIRN